MKQTIKSLLLSVAAMLCVVNAFAQVTTSSMNGTVRDKSGAVVPGAVVVAIHTPSGTQYNAVVNLDGRFFINGMRSGGPYTVKVSCLGYQPVSYTEITLALGEAYTLNASLSDDTQALEEAIVVSTAATKFTTEKTGAATNINSRQMSVMPTVNRSISDMAKLSPYANGMSFAGGDGRSSNFTVDGANFNNNFGLSEKLPGGGNPISIDAIDEIQVVVAPYDVRQTNFIGGGVNAITKSGTNTFKGTVYGYYRNQDMRGNTINGKDLGDRATESHQTYGFTLGGPIIKNKLFFFVNAEMEKTPGQVITYRANKGDEKAEGNVSRTTIADMEAVQKYMLEKYGYDTGSFTDFPGDESNVKLLARLDWNISDNHHLALRYNYTKNTSWSAPNGNSSDTGYRLNKTYRVGNESMAFANNMYSMDNLVHSVSADLNSRFTDRLSNQLLFTFTKADDIRGSKSDPFPHVDIIKQDASGNWKPYMSLGYELFSWNNGVHNNTITLKDDVTYLAGSHKITAGAYYEHQMADNAYMRNGTLYYRYVMQEGQSVIDALNSTPESFAVTYGWNGELNPAARVTFDQVGLYAQDEWDITKNFKLTYGARFETIFFNSKDIATNKAIYALDFGGKHIDTGVWPKPSIVPLPRVGFSWDVLGDKSLKVRGGTGIFAGRIPLVFFTNMPTNAGMVQNSVQFKSTWEKGQLVSINDDLKKFDNGMITNVPEAIEKLGLQKEISDDKHVAGSKIAGVDPDFKMPQIWKTSLAVDYALPVNFPFTVTAEGMFMKNINAVYMNNYNINASAITERFEGADNRLMYPKNFTYVAGKTATVLENTNEGYGYTANLTVNMEPVRNLRLMAAYTLTEMKEKSGMPGSDPASTWQGHYTIDGPNFATVQRSQYVVPNKVIASVSYFLPFRVFNGKGLNVSLFYTGMSSNGYSYTYSNDMNGDGISNDLMYIPANDSEIVFKDDTDRKAFWDFVAQDSYLSSHKGQYAEAYAARAPWVHRFDLHLSEDFAFRVGSSTQSFQLVLDFMNIGNLLNSKWGVYQINSIGNNSAPLKYEGTVAGSNTPMFSMNKNDNGYLTRSYDYSYSYGQCWQIQLGLRYFFN